MQTKTLLTAASLAASLLAVPAAMANHIDFFAEGNTQLLLLASDTDGMESSNVSEGNTNAAFPDTGDSILGNDRFTMIQFTPGQAPAWAWPPSST